MTSGLSMYNSIALDIARRIIKGDIPLGAKISGRTLLASHYNVSPETIRKAISLLKDANVVTVSQGKEIVVQSVEQAYHFVSHQKDLHSVYSLKQEIELLLSQKQEIDRRFEQVMGEIINFSDRLKNLTPFNPVEIQIPVSSHVIGKTISQVRFWDYTGATILAIRRGTEIIISPGSAEAIQAIDRIVVVGKEDILDKVTTFLNNNNSI